MELHEEILIKMDINYEELESQSQERQLEVLNKILDDIFDMCIKEGLKNWEIN